MESYYTRETWKEAYVGLLTALEEAGVPEEVGKYIAQNLKTEKCMCRILAWSPSDLHGRDRRRDGGADGNA